MPTTKNTLPKAILWDWDNTLADSWEIIHAALEKTFIDMGHKPLSMQEVQLNAKGIHRSLRVSFPEIFGDDWEKARDLYFNYFLATHLELVKLLPNALETLQGIHDLGIFQAIVSNKTGQYLRDEVKQCNVEHFFASIIGATDAEEDKPSAKPLILALESSDTTFSPNDIWMIGDSQTDIGAAKAFGCRAIHFASYKKPNAVGADPDVTACKDHIALQKLLTECAE